MLGQFHSQCTFTVPFASKFQVVVSVTLYTELLVFSLLGQQKINPWKKPIAKGFHLLEIGLCLCRKPGSLGNEKQVENHYGNVATIITNQSNTARHKH